MGSYLTALMRQQRERRRLEAYQEWRAGRVVPHRITMMLDLLRLDGPGVDEACGVQEPAVDMWEAGTLYPTWEQLCALAMLCGGEPMMFTLPLPVEYPLKTSLRFHKIGGSRTPWVEPPPVRMFMPEAVAATVGGAA